MKKSIILTMALFLSLLLSMGSVSFAEDVIKIGAGQPITGRFAFAGKHINAGLMD
ncbi:MAG: ABC transporter substrate-binding protein, partial [Deltaproteobacteria bacterium]